MCERKKEIGKPHVTRGSRESSALDCGGHHDVVEGYEADLDGCGVCGNTAMDGNGMSGKRKKKVRLAGWDDGDGG